MHRSCVERSAFKQLILLNLCRESGTEVSMHTTKFSMCRVVISIEINLDLLRYFSILLCIFYYVKFEYTMYVLLKFPGD